MTAVEHTPVLAGVCATDPYRSMLYFLQQLKAIGFCGIQNFPTVGLIDGNFRKNLESTGMSYQKEVDMIRTARQLDLLTTPYVFNVDEAERMTRAGADVLVVHLGLTTGGSIGATGGEITLDQCVQTIQEIRDACVKIEPEIIVLCHGGPISGSIRNTSRKTANDADLGSHRARRDAVCLESTPWRPWLFWCEQHGEITCRSRDRRECERVQGYRYRYR